MHSERVKLTMTSDGFVARLALNDPAKRNAMTISMFDAIDHALGAILASEARVVQLYGEGKTFCAGFDLEAARHDPQLIARFIERLSLLNRQLRRLPQPVVAAVHGAAVAGGCAVLSACDFVVVSPDALLGYPVHRIGVSPAVTIPTLMQAIGPGAARSLLMEGELIDGREAKRRGLASHLAVDEASLMTEAEALCAMLAAKPPNAVRVTKQWLNELDGSLHDAMFDQAAIASASLASTDEAMRMLEEHWAKRSSRS
ncbi:MAG TPA: enoyl-CoA hydratase/isomerase family protein [Phycisphaerales bacterium]|nr:enoyl-CoA hydratase/isomerase family protein [Phycisphaerales bacterium]HRQ76876.1 enoyl-CoA hydratase/isomerase family protein [Phycisphaerales bacterium]